MIKRETIVNAQNALQWIEENANISEIVMHHLYDLIREAKQDNSYSKAKEALRRLRQNV